MNAIVSTFSTTGARDREGPRRRRAHRRLRGSAFVAAALLLIALALAPSLVQAQAELPSSLQGENLHAAGSPAAFGWDHSLNQPDGSCDLAMGSTVHFIQAGTASGPYSGTFSEEGTFTIGAQPGDVNSTVPVRSFNSSFVIDSPAGQITGTKTLDFAGGRCLVLTDGGTTTRVVSINGFVHYEATIVTASGTFTDSGRATVRGETFSVDEGSGSAGSTFFDEYFVESNGVESTLPPLTDKDQCKNGGYAAYGFPNQGQCIAYVNSLD
jgi:hypothetical protein